MATSEQSEARCPGLPSTGSLGPLLLRDTLNIVVEAGNQAFRGAPAVQRHWRNCKNITAHCFRSRSRCSTGHVCANLRMQLPLTNGLEVPGLPSRGFFFFFLARRIIFPGRGTGGQPATRENWRLSSAAHQECCSCRAKRSDAQRRDRSHTLRVRSTTSYCRASSIVSAVRRRSSSSSVSTGAASQTPSRLAIG